MLIRTRTPPSGPFVNHYAMGQAAPDASIIYVAGVTGDDRSSGFINAPVKTLAEVGSRLRDSIAFGQDVTVNFLEPHPDEDGYPIDEICRPRFVAGQLRWRSDLQTEVSAEMVLTARSGAVYTFGAESWTVDQFYGAQLRWNSSTTPGASIGQTKDISHNTANTITVGYIHEAYPTFAQPSIGDVFQVVVPTVNLRLAPLDDGSTPSLYGGTGGVVLGDSRPRRGVVGLRNVNLRTPVGSSPLYWLATLGIEFTGVSLVGGSYLSAESCAMTAGHYVRPEFGPGEFGYGWGLTARAHPGGELAALILEQSLADIYTAIGALAVNVGARVIHQAGGITADSVYGAALRVAAGGFYEQAGTGSGYQYIFRTASESQTDILAISGGTGVVGKATHVGVGSHFRVTRGALIRRSGVFTVEGSTPLLATGFESRVSTGGKVELRAAYDNLGDVSAGSTPATLDTRASAAWAVGTRVAPTLLDLGESIMRVA